VESVCATVFRNASIVFNTFFPEVFKLLNPHCQRVLRKVKKKLIA
jgi:hypothetical protein